MAPHARQPGQQVLVLGQLHLQPALPCAGPLGKDVQNEGRTVQHLDPQFLGQYPLLGGGKGIVKDDQVRPRVPDQLLYLGGLAFSDKGARFRGVPVLQRHAHANAPRRLQQGFQLLHGRLRGALLPGQAVGAQAHQHRPVALVFGILRHKTSPCQVRFRTSTISPIYMRW